MNLTITCKPWWMAVAFLFLWLLTPLSVRADIPKEDKISKLDQPLAQVLEELGEKYQVFFSYNVDLISQVNVDFTYVKGESLNLAMERLLTKTNFTYETYGEKYFVIFEKTKKGIRDAKKLKRNVKRIHKLENKGSLNISPQRGETLHTIKQTANFLIAKTLKKNLSGTITNENGQALIGDSVSAKGTTLGALTDEQGKFRLTVPNEVTTLVVSYIGYATQEIEIAGLTDIQVSLKAITSTLEEVVVVGYGTQKKVNLTAAVSQVGKEFLENRPTANAVQSLQGVVPGLIITNSSTGSPLCSIPQRYLI